MEDDVTKRPAAGATESREGEGKDAEDKRLEILRAVERGDITVAEATDQLASLDEVLR